QVRAALLREKLQQLMYSLFKATSPNYEYIPPHSLELCPRLLVTTPISFDLLSPKGSVGFRPSKPATLMTVPEAPMNKNSRLIPRQDDIRRARETFVVQSEAVTLFVECSPHPLFWGGISRLDS